MIPDPVELTRALIRLPSVTPASEDAIAHVQAILDAAGFACHRPDRGGIPNLYARKGHASPVIGFAGHVDVVPVGDPSDWSDDPFGARMQEGRIYGRGACDMKSGVASFVAAAMAHEGPGSVALLITGDEEGDGVDGTAAILDWMEEAGERLDACIVGEPTCPETMGEMVKIGRRGSFTARIEARGRQGHVAYPHRATNPVHGLIDLLSRLKGFDLPDASDHFDPTSVQVTTIDTGNPSTNTIPATARAVLNIRFNDAHSGQSLEAWLRDVAQQVSAVTGTAFQIDVTVSGESFVTPPGPLSDLVSGAVEAVTGRRPVLSTSGGTSDARFIRRHCPVVECGLVGGSMHQVNEWVAVDEIRQLCAIYARIIEGFTR